MDEVKSNSEPETLDAPSTFGGRRPSPGSQFPFRALRQARECMVEVADRCIVDAVNATDQYMKWACEERAKNIRASIAEIERLELDWCNGAICFANDEMTSPHPRKESTDV